MVSSSPQRMVPYRSPSISLCSWQPEHQAAVAATPAFVKGVPGWLGREDPLEKEMVTHSSILAWRIPWTEEPGGLQFGVTKNLENSAVATGLEESVFIPIPKKGNPEECSNYCTIALLSHASKEMLKILQARL